MIGVWRITFTALAVVSFVFGFMLLARGATIACGPMRTVFARLLDRYGERPIWHGEANGGEVVLTVGREGSWSILVVRDGAACILAGGLQSTLDRGT